MEAFMAFPFVVVVFPGLTGRTVDATATEIPAGVTGADQGFSRLRQEESQTRCQPPLGSL